jgi:hypothetical protein
MERRRKFTAAKMAWSVTGQKAEYTPQIENAGGGDSLDASHVHSRPDGETAAT